MGRPRSAVRTGATLVASAVLAISAGCGGPAVQLLEDQAQRARLVTLRGEVAITSPSGAPLVVAVLRVPHHVQAALEIVDYAVLARPGRYSFFVDPANRYRVIAFEDTDGDMLYDPDERLGAWNGFADVAPEPGRVLELHIDITSGVPGPLPEVQMPTGEARSLYIGDLVPLSDARFGPENGARGVWEPLAFLREVGGGIFLTEPHRAGRTPVVLVHGMAGYPQEFEELVASLDADRFEPWLVQYPSGWELEPVADYLARGLVELSSALDVEGVCLVAHSMGGVVSRRTLAFLAERGHPELVRGFVTLASPLGGIPGAATGARFSPIQVPSWHSLVPDGPFMTGQYVAPLSRGTRYALFFAFDGEHGGDGVVPLTSQLRAEAQAEAELVRGFHTTHTGILEDRAALTATLSELDRCAGSLSVP